MSVFVTHRTKSFPRAPFSGHKIKLREKPSSAIYVSRPANNIITTILANTFDRGLDNCAKHPNEPLDVSAKSFRAQSNFGFVLVDCCVLRRPTASHRPPTFSIISLTPDIRIYIVKASSGTLPLLWSDPFHA